MKKSGLKLKYFFVPVFLGILSTILWSCSKSNDVTPSPDDDDDPATETIFKVSDFEIYDMELSDVFTDSNQIYYFYKVKNKTGKNYVSNSENGEFDVYFKAKGSDGAWYDSRESIDDINAGASLGQSNAVNCPEGIWLDASTFTYEVKVHE